MPALRHHAAPAIVLTPSANLSLVEWAEHLVAMAGDAPVAEWCATIEEEIGKGEHRGAMSSAMAADLMGFFDLVQAHA